MLGDRLRTEHCPFRVNGCFVETDMTKIQSPPTSQTPLSPSPPTYILCLKVLIVYFSDNSVSALRTCCLYPKRACDARTTLSLTSFRPPPPPRPRPPYPFNC